MKITYYLEVISSWCYWAEPAWADLKQRYAGRVEFGWKLSLMDSSGLPVSREQCEWFYRRSGTARRSPFMLNSGWFEAGAKEYLAPNLVAEAARDFGVLDDRARLAIAHAGLREGRKVGQWEISAEVAAAADRTGSRQTAGAREIGGGRSPRARDHRGISRPAGHATPDVSARERDWRSGGIFRSRRGRADRGDDRRDAGRRRGRRVAMRRTLGEFRRARGPADDPAAHVPATRRA